MSIALTSRVSLFALIAGLAGCASSSPGRIGNLPASGRYAYDFDAFGRTLHVTLYADNPARADEAATAVRGRLDDLMLKLDASRPDSELSRLCDDAGGPWTKVSAELFLLLQQTRRLSALAGGATDVTEPPAAALWHAAFEVGQLPPDDALLDARAAVGWQMLQTDPIERRVRLLLPGMRVDLERYAVAYAIDRAIEELSRHGVPSALIDAGDVLAVSGPPTGRIGWPITLPPARKNPKPRTIDLQHGAITLLGDDIRTKVIDGRTYADRVDPRTGHGVLVAKSAPRGVAVTATARQAFPAVQVAEATIGMGPQKSESFRRAARSVDVQFRLPTP